MSGCGSDCGSDCGFRLNLSPAIWWKKSQEFPTAATTFLLGWLAKGFPFKWLVTCSVSVSVAVSVVLGTSKKVVGFPGMAPDRRPCLSVLVSVLFYFMLCFFLCMCFLFFIFEYLFFICLFVLTVADLFVAAAGAGAEAAAVATAMLLLLFGRSCKMLFKAPQKPLALMIAAGHATRTRIMLRMRWQAFPNSSGQAMPGQGTKESRAQTRPSSTSHRNVERFGLLVAFSRNKWQHLKVHFACSSPCDSAGLTFSPAHLHPRPSDCDVKHRCTAGSSHNTALAHISWLWMGIVGELEMELELEEFLGERPKLAQLMLTANERLWLRDCNWDLGLNSKSQVQWWQDMTRSQAKWTRKDGCFLIGD